MNSETKTVVDALIADRTLDRLIGGNLYNDAPPDEAALPCVTYMESQTPALGADDQIALCQVVFDMECRQEKSAWRLAEAVILVMNRIGYMSSFMGDAGMSGLVHQVSLKFTKIKEG